MRGAQAGVVVLGVEPRVHARLVVGGGKQCGKRGARLRFEVGGEAVAAPGFAHRGLRAGLIADGEERARERKSPLGAVRRLAAEKGDGRARIGALLPQRRFGMPPQSHDTRPAWIGGEECGVAREVDAVVAVQDHPFDELAGHRIGDRGLDIGRVVLPALVREIDRLPDCAEIER